MGEKEKILNIGRHLIRNVGFMLEFIKKLSSLLTLMSFIVFRGSLGLGNPFNGLLDKLGKVGES